MPDLHPLVVRLLSPLAFIVATLVASPDAHAAPPEPPNKWDPWFEVGGFGASDDRNRAETNLFAPLWQDERSMVFAEGLGKFFEEDVLEGSIAVGYRRMTAWEPPASWPSAASFPLTGWNLGAWAGWDVRRTRQDNTFHQFSMGIEALAPVFDLRLNGYVPGSDPKDSPALTRVELDGSRIALVGGEEVPLSGLDGELGVRVLRLEGAGLDAWEHELRLFGGGFWFDDDEAVDEVAGPRARVEWRVHNVVPDLPGTQLAFEVEYQHDDFRDHQWEAGILLRVPFGPTSTTPWTELTRQERRMAAGIVRDVDLRTQRSQGEPVADAITDVPFDRVVQVDASSDVQAAIDGAGPNSLVIARGDSGTIAGGFTVGERQTFQGGASTIRVRGRDSNTVAAFTAPGARARVTAAGDVVNLAGSHTHVAGLWIPGGADGINGGDNLHNVAFTGNTITDVTSSAIELGMFARDVVIQDNHIARTGSFGVDFDDDSRRVLFERNTLVDIGSFGINFDEDSRDLWIRDNTFERIGSFGIDFDRFTKRIEVSRNVFRDIGSFGIDFDSDSSSFLVQDNLIENTDSFGIDIDSDTFDVRILRNTIRNTDSFGIDLDDNNDDVRVIGNLIENTDSFGIDVDDDSDNLVIKDNTIRNANSDFIDVDDDNTLSITGNVFIGNGSGSGDALDISDRNTGTIANNEFRGRFADDLIDLDGSGNDLDGGANVLEATFGDVFCEDVGGNGASNIVFENGFTCP